MTFEFKERILYICSTVNNVEQFAMYLGLYIKTVKQLVQSFIIIIVEVRKTTYILRTATWETFLECWERFKFFEKYTPV